jgi:hypothetical protein
MFLRREEWRELYTLRREMEDERDRRLLRRLIRYTEHLERRLKESNDADASVGQDRP